MAVMSDSATNATDPVSDEITLLVSQLLRTLDTLSAIGRRMHPPRIAEVVGLLGDQDTALDDAVQRFRAAFLPSRLNNLRDQLGESADLAERMRPAAHGGQVARRGGRGFRGLGYYTLAVEALYPLTASCPRQPLVRQPGAAR